VRDADDLVQKLAWLRAHPEEVARMGRNGRALAEREFDRDLLAGRVLDVLEEVAR
jgi:glycosyltransferase involved in cell wall biosynthesis